ncbi:GNAT family N-acetyltransferase [soil metagenome]
MATVTHRPLPGPADVLLAAGNVAVVRHLTPADAEALEALHARAGLDSLRFRFFSPSHSAAQQYVQHVLASPLTLALLAEVRGTVVALATAEPLDEQTSEVAFLVDDEFHHLGLGTLLLEHLAALARDQGIAHFVAEVLPDNSPMLRVFADTGFEVVRTLEQGVVQVRLSTLVTPAMQSAADDRECRAEARSLGALQRPSSVAVVGVRRDGTGVGAEIVRSVVAGGFTGRIAQIRRSADTDAPRNDGVPAYATVQQVPDGVDLVVLAVPAERCCAALEDAAAAGATVVVVVSSGFAEVGPAGVALQLELVTGSWALCVRLVGPNCLGVVANDPEVRLDATFGTPIPLTGGLALASQSGGVGIALVELARAEGLGLASFVSLGNKADVSGNDLLAAWYDDPAVEVAALYLESFGNARKFARLAQRFSERKPLLGIVGGRSSGGRRAGASHTAAAASTGIGVGALFDQAGVVRCRDADDLVDTARLLTGQSLPGGSRVAILSNAGGLGVLAADRADDLDLDVPELSADLQARLRLAVPGLAGAGNPVDAGAGAGPAELTAVVAELLGSGEIDSLLVVLVATALTDGREMVAAVSRAHAQHPEIPLVLVPLGGLSREGIGTATAYSTAGAALEALAHVTSYAAWRAAPHAPPSPHDDSAGRAARQAAAELVGAAPAAGSGWVDATEAGGVLAPYGIALSGARALSPDEAADVADRVGYPVVVKCADAAVIHKTERGLVRLGLGDRQQVLAAATAIADELGGAGPLLVQPQVTCIEIALCITRDPGLGPLVMVAAGGVATDVWDDRVFLAPPVTAVDAARAVRGLRLWPLLEGFRGTDGYDSEALEALVVAVGRLALEVPEIAELDLNPVVVGHAGCTVVDVALRLSGDRLAEQSALPARSLRTVR